MLVFGDLVWVPFTYSLQARYILVRSANNTAQSTCVSRRARHQPKCGFHSTHTSAVRPDTACLQEHPVGLSWLRLAAMLVLQIGGYAIFRGANGQKDLFRRNPGSPEVAHIKYINTARGTKLMVSGWWGLARHINYTGDWMMGWAWCLSCGALRSPPPPGHRHHHITTLNASPGRWQADSWCRVLPLLRRWRQHRALLLRNLFRSPARPPGDVRKDRQLKL